MGGGENGNVEMGLALEAKNKYRRIDDFDDAAVQHPDMERAKKYVFACSVFASLNSVLLGYDVGVMSGAILFIQEDLNITEVQQEILIGILSVVSILGSLAGGRTSDAIGRKWTMAFSAIVFQLGAAVMTFAPSFSVLIIGRILSGIGIGFGVMITPLYIAEISPSLSRGSLTSFPEISINLGILLGYVSNYAFSGLPPHTNWRVMLAVGILPSVITAFTLCVIPESPRWLVMQNRVDEARSVLLKINDDESQVEQRLAEIQSVAKLTDINGEVWRELLSPTPTLAKMLVAGFGIQSFQQITGIDATVYYSPKIFQAAGIFEKSQLLAATVAVGVTKTSFIVVAIVLIDRLGRKPLLYVSTIGMTVCLFVVGLTLSFIEEGSVSVALAIWGVCGNVGFFSLGMGPICWVLTSEIFPLRVRAQASALGAVGNRLCSGLVTMSFLSIAHAMTFGGVFFLFSAISAVSVVFVYNCIPETKGKSLEQMEMVFQDGCDNGVQEGLSEVQVAEAEHLVKKD